MAYALYYEKHRRFNDAEKMYRLGIQNLAEPIGELHKAHEQFRFRMDSYKKKDKLQERMPRKVGSSATSMNQVKGESRHYKELKSNIKQTSESSSNPSLGPTKVGVLSRGNSGANNNLPRCNSDDTVVVRFIGSALVGKSETEDACHHGLVEPTINTKEALDAINSMFMEPLEPETVLKRQSKRENPNHNQQTRAFGIFVDEDEPSGNNTSMLQNSMKQGHTKLIQQTSGFEIFVDEDGPNGSYQNGTRNRNSSMENVKLNQEQSGFEIFVDEDCANGNNQNAGQNRNCRKENTKLNQERSKSEFFVKEDEANDTVQNALCYKSNRYPPRPLFSDSSRHQGESDFQKPFVGGFAILPDDEEPCEKSYGGANINCRTVQPTHNTNNLLCPVQDDSGTRNREGPHSVTSGLQEDTVIRRFVASSIDDEPKVENAWHHGLVDPTVNLKEAMDDINSMFGKPLNFKGEKTKRKTIAQSDGKATPISGFSILADDDLKEGCTSKASQSNSFKFGDENGLFEPTITTRDVMAEINDMFGMPLDL